MKSEHQKQNRKSQLRKAATNRQTDRRTRVINAETEIILPLRNNLSRKHDGCIMSTCTLRCLSIEAVRCVSSVPSARTFNPTVQCTWLLVLRPLIIAPNTNPSSER